ncbi:hypothetical protein N7468_000067 [Penicillium chermesinum]|uniref:Uncharacterized protein n=1 Tax=Penicillium chermesinum TaxID=63820 RepID=A0A9W9U037_9EURO|nr:uncharacterized protein N7468_000067 [Penicillium chermesinum]KAJ5248616.1 hypothetical protein N7468_000067 [Penicillium chermesinum]
MESCPLIAEGSPSLLLGEKLGVSSQHVPIVTGTESVRGLVPIPLARNYRADPKDSQKGYSEPREKEVYLNRQFLYVSIDNTPVLK